MCTGRSLSRNVCPFPLAKGFSDCLSFTAYDPTCPASQRDPSVLQLQPPALLATPLQAEHPEFNSPYPLASAHPPTLAACNRITTTYLLIPFTPPPCPACSFHELYMQAPCSFFSKVLREYGYLWDHIRVVTDLNPASSPYHTSFPYKQHPCYQDLIKLPNATAVGGVSLMEDFLELLAAEYIILGGVSTLGEHMVLTSEFCKAAFVPSFEPGSTRLHPITLSPVRGPLWVVNSLPGLVLSRFNIHGFTGPWRSDLAEQVPHHPESLVEYVPNPGRQFMSLSLAIFCYNCTVDFMSGTLLQPAQLSIGPTHLPVIMCTPYTAELLQAVPLHQRLFTAAVDAATPVCCMHEALRANVFRTSHLLFLPGPDALPEGTRLLEEVLVFGSIATAAPGQLRLIALDPLVHNLHAAHHV